MKKLLLALTLLLPACATGAYNTLSGDRWLTLVNSATHTAQVWYRRGNGVYRLSYPLGIGEERLVRVPIGALNGGSGEVLLGVEFMDGLFISDRARFGWALQSFVPQPCYSMEVRIGPFPSDIGPTGREEFTC